MKAKNSGNDIQFDPAPVGNNIARCIRVVDLGTKMDDYWGKEKHECWIMWELPNELHTYTIKGKDGQQDTEVTEPFTVSKFYTLSLSEKAHLRHDLASWRGKAFTEQELEGFEMKKVLGAPCMVNVIHTPKKKDPSQVNAVVTAVTGLPKGLECPEAVHDLVYFSLDAEEYDAQVLESLSKGIKARIMQSNEWLAMQAGADPAAPVGKQPAPAADEFDDIPF